MTPVYAYGNRYRGLAERSPGSTHYRRARKLGIEVRDRVPLGFVRLIFDSTVPTRSASAPRSLFNKSIQIFQEAAVETGDEVLARVDLMPGRSGSDEVIRSLATWYQWIAIGTTEGRVHVIDFEGRLLMSSCVGRGPVSALVADHRGLRAPYCAGLLTTFEDNDISGCCKTTGLLCERDSARGWCARLALEYGLGCEQPRSRDLEGRILKSGP
ncbi:MAG TPA: hypothetical protein VN442_21875 [Bryobacteraceae bacterium]|nr:hypothetical protein [Bryobacteraceae bacterium]